MPGRDAREQAGIVRPAASRERIAVGRCDPPAMLAEHVDYFWWVRWDTPEPHVQQVIPRPVVHLSAEAYAGEPRLVVHGVHRTRFERRLEGAGRTVAAAFRPGGFRAFLGSDVGDLVDREVPLGDLLDVDDRPLARRLLGDHRGGVGDGEAAGALALGAWLAGLEPTPDPLVDRIAGLVERAEQDRSIVRADQLAELAGVGLRTLQRQFRAYVGVGPKWVVQRCRLLDVAEAAHGDGPVDWAALAAELGYADQSHLIRGFTALVGHPPAAYAGGG